MSDDPSKRGGADRNRVAADQEHEIRYFAEQNGISTEQALALIKQHGNDRSKLAEEAKRLRS